MELNGIDTLRFAPSAAHLRLADRGLDSIRTPEYEKRALHRRALFSYGAERDRTVDLLNAIQTLSQLSYSPTRRLLHGCQRTEADGF